MLHHLILFHHTIRSLIPFLLSAPFLFPAFYFSILSPLVSIPFFTWILEYQDVYSWDDDKCHTCYARHYWNVFLEVRVLWDLQQHAWMHACMGFCMYRCLAFFWHIFHVLLTVHPCTIFFQIKPTRCTVLLSTLISTSIHVLGNYVNIIRRTYCIYVTLVFFTLYGWLSGLQNRPPPIQSEKYQCHIDTLSSPVDVHIVTRNT